MSSLLHFPSNPLLIICKAAEDDSIPLAPAPNVGQPKKLLVLNKHTLSSYESLGSDLAHLSISFCNFTFQAKIKFWGKQRSVDSPVSHESIFFLNLKSNLQSKRERQDEKLSACCSAHQWSGQNQESELHPGVHIEW